MMLKELRTAVLEANLELVRRGLVLYTFGNASGVDRGEGLVVIKPSGVEYDELRPELMVVTDLDGKVVEGTLRPSSDLETHTLLYREFPAIGGVVHTHSEFATSFAQAGMEIPALGTTHADTFYGPVPCTAPLTDEAIGGRYVHETGVAIVRRFAATAAGPDGPARAAIGSAGRAGVPGGRTWAVCVGQGRSRGGAQRGDSGVCGAHGLPDADAEGGCGCGVSQALLDRHYFRKHGPGASYGQG
jgi:L-ribulose-5-phosphate 4-epimerase